jgi:hypothetical protein|nr:MAG TPA: hypothetical protein [Caudoviricetes sp.]DAV98742.1 MAG TPA: hypothetical protein [Bacteriophage sp.]
MASSFEIDTDKYKDLLRLDGDYDKYGGEVVDAEIIEDDHHSKEEVILPAKALKDLGKIQKDVGEPSEKVRGEVSKAYTELVSHLNKEYGLNVSLDFDSFTNSITNLTSDKSEKAAEYYLSKVYGKFRVVMYQQYLRAISLLASQILDPNYMMSESMTYADKMDMMTRVLDMMSKMNEIYGQVKIPDTEEKLKKLSEDTSNDNKMSFRNPKYMDLVDKLNDSLLKEKKDEKPLDK